MQQCTEARTEMSVNDLVVRVIAVWWCQLGKAAIAVVFSK